MTALPSPRKGYRKVKALVIFLGAVLSGIVFWSEQIQKLFEGKAIGYFIAFSGLMRIDEILILILVVLLWDHSYTISCQAIPYVWNMAVHGEHATLTSAQARLRGATISIWVVAMLCVASYHLSYLAIGKMLFISNYDKRLLTDSTADFLKGNVPAAKARLDACITVLHSERCRIYMERIDERMQLAKSMRLLLDKMQKNNYQGRTTLLEDINYLENNKLTKEDSANSLKQELDDLQIVYGKSLELIITGNLPEAEKTLGEINTRFPGYGDAHILTREIDERMKNPSAETPYLLALKTLGPSPFSAQTVGATLAFKKLQPSLDE